jgi:hypothetical protein
VRASRERAFLDPPQDWGGYMQLDDGFRCHPTRIRSLKTSDSESLGPISTVAWCHGSGCPFPFMRVQSGEYSAAGDGTAWRPTGLGLEARYTPFHLAVGGPNEAENSVFTRAPALTWTHVKSMRNRFLAHMKSMRKLFLVPHRTPPPGLPHATPHPLLFAPQLGRSHQHGDAHRPPAHRSPRPLQRRGRSPRPPARQGEGGRQRR